MTSPAAELAQTPLHDWHASHGGRMVDFGGWSMPVQYSSIIDEHNYTRKAAGLFDVSHMGRLLIEGTGATDLLESVLTRRISDIKPWQVRYSLVCNDTGGVLDDVLVYHLDLSDKPSDTPSYGMVVNASNRTKIVSWLACYADPILKAGKAVTVEDITETYSMIAVQGPKAIELLDPITDCELTSLRYYTGQMMQFTGLETGPVECYLSRTGYTGEDGGELVCPAEHAAAIWDRLVTDAQALGGGAVGLAARDTLRLEAGMPLYGHELSEEINPIQAGLGFAVNLGSEASPRAFAGRDALAVANKDNRQLVRVGLQLDGKRSPREGYRVLQGTEEVGHVTSGTFSPTLGRPIAMAYVKPTAAGVGEHLAVEVRGTELPATVTPLPFYQRGK